MTTNKNLIREQNLKKLKTLLFKKGTLLKAELSDSTGISVVTINSLIKELLAENVVIEGEPIQQPLGRPAIPYHFNYNQQHFLLLSIQEQKVNNRRQLLITGKIVNLKGEVKYSQVFEYGTVSIEGLVDKVAHFIDQDIPIRKIGLSFPGKIHKGVVVSSWGSLFDGWEIEAAVATLTPIPIVIENDAHLLTLGHIVSSDMAQQETYVGVFFPEDSMPGITIYSHQRILTGHHQLAGEAKYLPHLLKSAEPTDQTELINYLIEILEIYNAVIAPESFIISADSVSKKRVSLAFDDSHIIANQINTPHLRFINDFQETLETGLRWLVTKDSDYQL